MRFLRFTDFDFFLVWVSFSRLTNFSALYQKINSLPDRIDKCVVFKLLFLTHLFIYCNSIFATKKSLFAVVISKILEKIHYIIESKMNNLCYRDMFVVYMHVLFIYLFFFFIYFFFYYRSICIIDSGASSTRTVNLNYIETEFVLNELKVKSLVFV